MIIYTYYPSISFDDEQVTVSVLSVAPKSLTHHDQSGQVAPWKWRGSRSTLRADSVAVLHAIGLPRCQNVWSIPGPEHHEYIMANLMLVDVG